MTDSKRGHSCILLTSCHTVKVQKQIASCKHAFDSVPDTKSFVWKSAFIS